MTVVFRVDASVAIGSGHVMRCLTLANALTEKGMVCLFICREHEGNLISKILDEGYKVQRLTNDYSEKNQMVGDNFYNGWLGAGQLDDASESIEIIKGSRCEWLTVDHYGLDIIWESKLRDHCNKLMVVDDLANRSHLCNLLLDQNLGRDFEDYSNLVPDYCSVLLGPMYALVREEFSALRERSLSRREKYKLKNILITMGGIDKINATGRVLDALTACMLPDDCVITIVMGQEAVWLSQIQIAAENSSLNTRIVINANNMGELMLQADLCIGAAGSTSWERCAMGLPSILFCVADNQKTGLDALSKTGAVLSMGLTGKSIKPIELHNKIAEISAGSYEMVRKAALITDGMGCHKIIDIMEL